MYWSHLIDLTFSHGGDLDNAISIAYQRQLGYVPLALPTAEISRGQGKVDIYVSNGAVSIAFDIRVTRHQIRGLPTFAENGITKLGWITFIEASFSL